MCLAVIEQEATYYLYQVDKNRIPLDFFLSECHIYLKLNVMVSRIHGIPFFFTGIAFFT